MSKNKKAKRVILTIVFILAGMLLVLVGMSLTVHLTPQGMIVKAEDVKNAECIIVPGARVNGDFPSATLEDRLKVAYDLYAAGKAPKILVSGDHGTKDYDEVNAMREYLLKKGVPIESIFMDHAGFDTYQTMKRAKEVFEVQSAVVVTQDFHLPRALFLAESVGLKVQGVESSLRRYGGEMVWTIREIPAAWKACFEALFQPDPKYLGDSIPISGDGRDTENGKTDKK